MPRYLFKGNTARAVAGIATLDDANAYYTTKTIIFYNDLANKLEILTTSLKNTFTDLRKNCGKGSGTGILFAEVIIPSQVVGIKYEYIEYIKRYGPPSDGKFDEAILTQIRAELNLNGI